MLDDASAFAQVVPEGVLEDNEMLSFAEVILADKTEQMSRSNSRLPRTPNESVTVA